MLHPSGARPTGSSFELWAWFFMRITGIILVVMALVHLAIMHVFTPIQQVNYAFVAARWASPLWRWYDLILLSLALLHGMNGLRVVGDDHVHSRGRRVFAMTILYVVTFVFFVVGAQVILSFQPAAAR